MNSAATHMNELLPCPFCGGEADLCSGGHEWWVKCTFCDASTEMQGMGKQKTAIELWNTRTPTQVKADDAMVEKLKGIIDYAIEIRQRANDPIIYGISGSIESIAEELIAAINDYIGEVRDEHNCRYKEAHAKWAADYQGVGHE